MASNEGHFTNLAIIVYYLASLDNPDVMSFQFLNDTVKSIGGMHII